MLKSLPAMQNPWHYFQSGHRRIKRFIAWFPIIWRDEEWDAAYLYEIMRFKISRMGKSMEKNAIHVGYEKRVREMKVAQELLSRISMSKRYSPFYDDLSEELQNRDKAGKCSCPEKKYRFEPAQYDFQGKILTERLVFLHCNYCESMQRHWFAQDDAKQQADFNFLFNHLKKHSKK